MDVTNQCTVTSNERKRLRHICEHSQSVKRCECSDTPVQRNSTSGFMSTSKTGNCKKRVKPECIYYTEEEKAAAVQFYHDNKGSYQDAADKLGYPSLVQLRLWVIAAQKEREKACEISPYMIEYTKEDFIKPAIEFCTNESNLVSIGQKYHIAPNTIKKAAAVLLSKEYKERMWNYEKRKSSINICLK